MTDLNEDLEEIEEQLIFNKLNSLASRYCTGCYYNSLSQYKHTDNCLFKSQHYHFYLNKVVCELYISNKISSNSFKKWRKKC